MTANLVVSEPRSRSRPTGLRVSLLRNGAAERSPSLTVTLKEQAYLALRSQIVDLDVQGGPDPIWIDEREIAGRLRMSRTPVREALAVLERQGLVCIHPRRGIAIVRKSKAEVVEMIQAWAALAGLAARLSAGNASDDELALLSLPSPSILSTVSARGRARKIEAANSRCQAALIRLSGCGVIAFLVDGFYLYVQSVWVRTAAKREYVAGWIRDHAKIVTALQARDARVAEHLVQQHALELTQYV